MGYTFEQLENLSDQQLGDLVARLCEVLSAKTLADLFADSSPRFHLDPLRLAFDSVFVDRLNVLLPHSPLIDILLENVFEQLSLTNRGNLDLSFCNSSFAYEFVGTPFAESLKLTCMLDKLTSNSTFAVPHGYADKYPMYTRGVGAHLIMALTVQALMALPRIVSVSARLSITVDAETTDAKIVSEFAHASFLLNVSGFTLQIDEFQ